MKQCNTCGRDLPDSEFYSSKMTKDSLRGECRTCTSWYVRRRRESAGRDPEYRRQVRTVRNSCGSDSFLVAIPPAVYHALGGPHTILWTIRDDGVEIEAVG